MNHDGHLDFTDRNGPFIRLCAVGDLSFHGKIQDMILRQGTAHVFKDVKASLLEADIRIGNLESVLLANQVDANDSKSCLLADSIATECLLDAKFDVLTFANNHVLDAGPQGAVECMNILAGARLPFTGAGKNLGEAHIPVIISKAGQKFRFWGYSYGMGQIAKKDRPGCAEANLNTILKNINTNPVDGVFEVVSLHMDAEFQETPAPARVDFCRKLAEHGISLILCHHPHVPQGIERWGESLIAYSLGNYIFSLNDYMRSNSNDCQKSFHLMVDFDEQGIRGAEIIPVVLDQDGKPILANGSDKEEILELVTYRSVLLRDRHALTERYLTMISLWSKSLIKGLYWALGERDWRKFKQGLLALKSTKTKRDWLRDFLLIPLHKLGLHKY